MIATKLRDLAFVSVVLSAAACGGDDSKYLATDAHATGGASIAGAPGGTGGTSVAGGGTSSAAGNAGGGMFSTGGTSSGAGGGGRSSSAGMAGAGGETSTGGAIIGIGGVPMAGGGTATVGGTPSSGGNPGGGGVGTGGLGAGGAPTGGTALGGAGTGGMATGGAPAGGAPTGGITAAGAPTGGTALGGAGTGGMATGGAPTGGVATGGVATGGAPTGGVATGGVATGGVATGGSGGCTPDYSCAPTAPSTSDFYADCITRINQFRACVCVPPVTRYSGGEACANQDAQYDYDQATPHAGFTTGICTPQGSAENECADWASTQAAVDGCLQMMFNEGPGSDNTHRDYINMTNPTYTRAACGFYLAPTGQIVWAVQHFFP